MLSRTGRCSCSRSAGDSCPQCDPAATIRYHPYSAVNLQRTVLEYYVFIKNLTVPATEPKHIIYVRRDERQRLFLTDGAIAVGMRNAGSKIKIPVLPIFAGTDCNSYSGDVEHVNRSAICQRRRRQRSSLISALRESKERSQDNPYISFCESICEHPRLCTAHDDSPHCDIIFHRFSLYSCLDFRL